MARLLSRPTAILILGTLVAGAPGCTFGRIVVHNFSGVDDHEIFASRALPAAPVPFRFAEKPDASLGVMQVAGDGEAAPSTLDEFLEANDTLAFLVIRRDEIVHERYFQDHGPHRISLSMSMAKSILSLLIGCAISDGLISGVDDPVSRLVPEMAERGFDRVTVRHLLQMTGATSYVESDNPFTGDTPWFYYTGDLRESVLGLSVAGEPGTTFSYSCGETQLLGLVLERALGGETITAYLGRKLWTPLGMESDGQWSLDREGGMEKTFCCIAATARDFAKFGRLVLRGGEWNGARLVPAEWIRDSVRRATPGGMETGYGYQWWLPFGDTADVMASGHLGQYLYISPANDTIVVRLGRSLGGVTHSRWRRLLRAVAERRG